MRTVRGSLGRILTILALAAIGLGVGGYIFANQNVDLPAWAPGGKSTSQLNARFVSANGVMPGQGQAVTIAGVPVGKVSGVRLDRGQAVVSMTIEQRYAGRIHPNATLLLRPKTPLKDMVVQLDPGTAKSGPALKSGAEITVDQTEPDVDFDQIIASLDTDTRAQLATLLGDAGTAIGGNGGRALARALRRFEPLSRRSAEASRLLARRGTQTRRLVTNLGRVTSELGSIDARLAEFISGNAALFRRFANQNGALGETIRRLPPTLKASTAALRRVGAFSSALSTTLPAVRPATRELAGALRDVRPFLDQTRPVLEKQLRPFARDAQPVARDLRPAVRLTAASLPGLSRTTTVLNRLFDSMAYDPPGNAVGQQSYLFYLPWAAHNTNSAVSTQDATSPMRRSIVLFSCGAQLLLNNYDGGSSDSPYIRTLIDLLNPPRSPQNCPQGDATK